MPLEVIGICNEAMRVSSSNLQPVRVAYNITIELQGEDLERMRQRPRLPIKVILPPVPKTPGQRLCEMHYAHRERQGLRGPEMPWAQQPDVYRRPWEATAAAVGYK